MISHLLGTVIGIGPNWAVIDINGMGLKFGCTPATAASLRPHQEAKVATSLVVREDSLTLFGFLQEAERDAFELVQSASGVGPKVALAMVSVLTPAQLREAVLSGNVRTLCLVPGIGLKGAQKLIIELKDKVLGLDVGEAADRQIGSLDEEWREQVSAGLEGLGWSSRDAQSACESVAPLREQDPTTPVAVLMKAALQGLARA